MASREQIAEHISANICHCGTYPRMYVLIAFCCDALGPLMAVRPEGANHQWRKNPPGELSIDPAADERLVRVTAWVGAS
jgi:hypothetical protein